MQQDGSPKSQLKEGGREATLKQKSTDEMDWTDELWVKEEEEEEKRNV